MDALAANWRLLSAPLRLSLRDEFRDGLGSAAVRAARAGGDVARVSAALLVRDLGDPALAGALVPLVRAREEGVQDAVAAALLELAASHGANEAASREFRSALAMMASGQHEHKQRAVAETVILTLSPALLAFSRGRQGEPLLRWYYERDQQGHAAVRSALKKMEGTPARRRAWEWLGREEVAAAALDRVKRVCDAAGHDAVLAAAHLVVNPGRRRRAALAGGGSTRRNVGGLLPRAQDMERLSVEARRGLPRMIGASGAPPAEAAELVAALKQDPDPVVRVLVANRQAGSLWATGELDSGTERDSRLAAARLLASDPSRVVAELRARIADGEASSRVVAITRARRLGIQKEVELELLAAMRTAGAGAERVIATAARALCESQSLAGLQVFQACMQHTDPRVRANAVEAICRRSSSADGEAPVSRELRSQLLGLVDDAHHRVRASAVRSLAMGGLIRDRAAAKEAGEAVQRMLGDERPLHRLSGLWAAGRVMLAWGPRAAGGTCWSQVPVRVARLAKGEPEEPVRGWAVRLAELLVAMTRVEWQSRVRMADMAI